MKKYATKKPTKKQVRSQAMKRYWAALPKARRKLKARSRRGRVESALEP